MDVPAPPCNDVYQPESTIISSNDGDDARERDAPPVIDHRTSRSSAATEEEPDIAPQEANET